jgi:hypothetical protein
MKTIENKQVDISAPTRPDIKVASSYAELIKIVCDSPIQGGYDIKDIEHRIKIKGAASMATERGSFELEDADADYLRKAVMSMKWGISHEDILKFYKDIEKL